MIQLDPNDEVLTCLYQRFTKSQDSSGKEIRVISYNGKEYPVMSVIPKNASFDYIIMNPVEYTDDSAKDNDEYECTILFDIVTLGMERGSWNSCNYISSEISKLIMKRDIVTQNYKSTVYPIVDSTNSFTEEVNSGIILRRLIRYRFIIQQI